MRYESGFLNCLKMIAALLVTASLMACTSSGARQVIPRELPPKPEWVQPAWVAKPSSGTDWREIAAIENAARKRANSTIIKFGQWYDERRVEYQGQVK